MTIKIPKINKSEQIFFLSYGIYLFFSILSTSFYYRYFTGIYKFIIMGCGLLILVSELKKVHVNRKGFAGLIVCISLFFITYFSSSGAVQNTIPLMFLLIYAARNIRFEKIALFTVIVSSFLVGFIILSAELGFIENYLYMKGGRTRYFLGFRYALYAPTLYFNIVLLIAYLKKSTVKYYQILFLLLINYWLFAQTNSRITFYMTIMILIFAVWMKKVGFKQEKKYRLLGIGCFAVVICAGLSIGLSVFYDPSVEWMYNLNAILSGRLRLGQNALLSDGFSLFGQNVSWVGNGLDAYGNMSTEAYSWVDSMYVQILIHYGIVFLLVFIIIMTLLLFRCYKDREYALLISLIMIVAHCMIDDLQLYLHYNTFWFAAGSVLMSSARGISQNKHMNFQKTFPKPRSRI